MCLKVSVVGGKEVIENWEGGGGATCQYCTVYIFIESKIGPDEK